MKSILFALLILSSLFSIWTYTISKVKTEDTVTLRGFVLNGKEYSCNFTTTPKATITVLKSLSGWNI